MKKTILTLAAALLAVPAFAADLTMKVDTARNMAAITNNLASKVSLLYMEGGDGMNYPFSAAIAAKATVNIPLRAGVPASIRDAVCEVGNAPSGLARRSDGRYLLTVDLIEQ